MSGRGTTTAPHATGCITAEINGNVGEIVIDNPRQRNALTREMCIDLAEQVRRLDADPRVTVITLRGRGDDFSAGAAINELDQVLFDAGEDGENLDHLSAADAAICAALKPTVALVRGTCMGGGWQIASACDISIAADSVRLAVTPSKLGIIYPRCGVERLVQRLGADKAKYVLFSADLISADKAALWGLLTDVVSEDEFETVSHALVSRMATRSQYSIRTMKSLIDSMVSESPEHDDLWEEKWAKLPASEDFAVGRQAFLEGKRPRFTWDG
ncbi:crotonase [Arthrobacter sp. 7749]|nr:crotonase [Arthrobacter sp. 7749]